MKRIFFLALIATALFSCKKDKIVFDANTAPDPTINPPECEACHAGTFIEHNSNAHSKHTVGLYQFACSTCHYGHGWETNTHMDATKDITFDPNGLATRNGADSNTPVYDSATKTCTNVYCHSSGNTADRGTDGTYTWGDLPFATTVYDTTPNWESGKINACVYCHNGLGEMTSPYEIERPNSMTTGNYPASGQHQALFHMDNDMDFSNTANYSTPIWDGVQCFWCHTTNATDVDKVNGPILQGTYGTGYHVDGQTHFKPLSLDAGGTMANGMGYSSDGAQAHCGSNNKCW